MLIVRMILLIANFLVKQRYIPSRMLTAVGKEIAEKRVKFMKNFFDKLDEEVYG